jgi:hypothetical protein
MATIQVAPKLSEGVAPSGSIRLDDLVKRYLVSIGAREFRFFTIPELSHFALLALYHVLRSRGLKDIFFLLTRKGEGIAAAYVNEALVEILPDLKKFFPKNSCISI